jgi:hypothetical protein
MLEKKSMTQKVDLTQEFGDLGRSSELEQALFNQFNLFHENELEPVKELELILLNQKNVEYNHIDVKMVRPELPTFSPSGASKCARELFYKDNDAILPHEVRYPYQRRWTRNSTAVHEVIQKDLLYMGNTMKDPAFKVNILENGLPAWEDNIKSFVIVEHNGEKFAVLGMMDGILTYKDGSTIGFEFKTKSNTLGQVGYYKMKDSAPYHKEQCVAYSLIFGMDEFILMYESVVKDHWHKGQEAKIDFRTFYYKVNDEAKTELLDRFAYIAKCIRLGEVPDRELDKCMFCQYIDECKKEDTEGELN